MEEQVFLLWVGWKVAMVGLQGLLDMGYSSTDVISTIFRVVRNYPADKMEEFVKLEFLRVSPQTYTADMTSVLQDQSGWARHQCTLLFAVAQQLEIAH